MANGTAAPSSLSPAAHPGFSQPPRDPRLGRFVAESFETFTLAQIFDVQVGTTASLDATHARTGTQALKIHQTGTANASIRSINSLPIVVGRFAFWIASNPSATLQQGQCLGGVNAVFQISTAGIQTAGFTGATIASGITVTDSAWHVIDYRVDLRGSTYLMDWMVDGVAQTQATIAAAGARAVSQFKFASSGAVTIDYWLDDWQLSDDWGSYPLADPPIIGGNQTVSPPAATASASAPLPAVQIQVPPAAATASASSPVPIPALTVPPAAATASASAPAPVPQLQVPPTAATAAASSPPPVLPIAAPVATASASALVPGVALQVPVPAATASASAPIPTLQLSVPVPAATASASAPTPTPQLQILAPVATASASAPVPVVTSAPIVTPPAATASASAPVPTIQVQVPAPVATATANGPVPTVTAAIMVLPPVATASASSLVPAVKLQIAATLATAAASAPLPAFGVTIILPAATATASAKLPTLQLNIATPSATAAAAAFAPFVTTGGLVIVTAPFRSSPRPGVTDSATESGFRDRPLVGASSHPQSGGFD